MQKQTFSISGQHFKNAGKKIEGHKCLLSDTYLNNYVLKHACTLIFLIKRRNKMPGLVQVMDPRRSNYYVQYNINVINLCFAKPDEDRKCRYRRNLFSPLQLAQASFLINGNETYTEFGQGTQVCSCWNHTS